MDKQESNIHNEAKNIESGETASSRAWVKPVYEREPLKEALSGGTILGSDGPQSCHS